MKTPVSPVRLQYLTRLLRSPAATTALLLAICSGSAADDLVDARQILLPVADVSADPSWSLYSGDEGYARSLQDLSADLSRHDGLGTAAFAAAGGAGDALTVRLKSGAPPGGARLGDHILHVWPRAAQVAGASFRVALLQGETELWRSGLWNATASFQELTKTVPQDAALAITDYQDLRVRFYSQGRPFYLTKAYLEVGEDLAPDLGYPDTAVWDGNVNVLQYEVDPFVTGVSWAEDHGPGRSGEIYAYCSAVDPQTGRPRPIAGARGVSMGLIEPHSTPQTGRRASGPFAVTFDEEGYIVTCDIDETNPQRSVVTRWSGPDLDPLDGDPDARRNRAAIFATKDHTQPDRILVYSYRDPSDDGADEIYLVDLDSDPLNHIRIWDPPPPPPGQLDALPLSPTRTLAGTPYWFWGCYSSTAPGTPAGICRMDLRDLPNVVVHQVIDAPEGVMFGWPFIGVDGRQRWIAGFDPPGGAHGFSDSGLRQYVEAEPLWVAEMDYPVDTDLWAPSFAMPARAQSAEVAGPDDLGRYFVVFSTHDLQDIRGPLEFGEYGKIVAAVIGDPASAVVVSRKQNHQVQIEPEPFILNGALQVAYSETQTGPLSVPDEGVIQERCIDLARFPTN